MNISNISDILSQETIDALIQLLDNYCPSDGSGVSRQFLLQQSGVLASLVEKGMLHPLAIGIRNLTTADDNTFKKGKLPEDLKFPPAEEIQGSGQDYVGSCYEWYKDNLRIVTEVANLLVLPITLRLTDKFVFRRGPQGGVCRVTSGSVNDGKSMTKNSNKSKAVSIEWSNEGLPSDFLEKLNGLCNKYMPLGSETALTAKQLAHFLGIDLKLAPKISLAVKSGLVPGFSNRQKKGVTRSENVKSATKTNAQSSENSASENASSLPSSLTEDFNSLFNDLDDEPQVPEKQENSSLTQED